MKFLSIVLILMGIAPMLLIAQFEQDEFGIPGDHSLFEELDILMQKDLSSSEYLNKIENELQARSLGSSDFQNHLLSESLCRYFLPKISQKLFQQLLKDFSRQWMDKGEAAVSADPLDLFKDELLSECQQLEENSFLRSGSLERLAAWKLNQSEDSITSYFNSMMSQLSYLEELNDSVEIENDSIHSEIQSLFSQWEAESDHLIDQLINEGESCFSSIEDKLEEADQQVSFNESVLQNVESWMDRNCLVWDSQQKLLSNNINQYLSDKKTAIEVGETIWREAEERVLAMGNQWDAEINEMMANQQAQWEQYGLAISENMEKSICGMEELYSQTLFDLNHIAQCYEEAELSGYTRIENCQNDLNQIFLNNNQIADKSFYSDKKNWMSVAGFSVSDQNRILTLYEQIEAGKKQIEFWQIEKKSHLFEWLTADVALDLNSSSSGNELYDQLSCFSITDSDLMIYSLLSRDLNQNRLIFEAISNVDSIEQLTDLVGINDEAIKALQNELSGLEGTDLENLDITLQIKRDISQKELLNQYLQKVSSLLQQDEMGGEGYLSEQEGFTSILSELKKEQETLLNASQKAFTQFVDDCVSVDEEVDSEPVIESESMTEWIDSLSLVALAEEYSQSMTKAVQQLNQLVDLRVNHLEESTALLICFSSESEEETLTRVTAYINKESQECDTFYGHLQKIHAGSRLNSENEYAAWLSDFSGRGITNEKLEQFAAASLYLSSIEEEGWGAEYWYKDYDPSWLLGEELSDLLKEEEILDVDFVAGKLLKECYLENFEDEDFYRFYDAFHRNILTMDLQQSAISLIRREIFAEAILKLNQKDQVVKEYAIAAAALAPTIIGGIVLSAQALNEAYKRDRLEAWIESAAENFASASEVGLLYETTFNSFEKDSDLLIKKFENLSGEHISQNILFNKMKNGELTAWGEDEKLMTPLSGESEVARLDVLKSLYQYQVFCGRYQAKEEKFDDVRLYTDTLEDSHFNQSITTNTLTSFVSSAQDIRVNYILLEQANSLANTLCPQIINESVSEWAENSTHKSQLSQALELSLEISGSTALGNSAGYIDKILNWLESEPALTELNASTGETQTLSALEQLTNGYLSAIVLSEEEIAVDLFNDYSTATQQQLTQLNNYFLEDSDSILTSNKRVASEMTLQFINESGLTTFSPFQFRQIYNARLKQINQALAMDSLKVKEEACRIDYQLSFDQSALIQQNWLENCLDAKVSLGNELNAALLDLQIAERGWKNKFQFEADQIEKDCIEVAGRGLTAFVATQTACMGTTLDKLCQDAGKGLDSYLNNLSSHLSSYKITTPAPELSALNQPLVFKKQDYNEVDEKLVEMSLAYQKETQKLVLSSMAYQAVNVLKGGWNDLYEMMKKLDQQYGLALENQLTLAGFTQKGNTFSRQAITGQTLFEGTIMENQRIGDYKSFDLSLYDFSSPQSIAEEMKVSVEALDLFLSDEKEQMNQLLVQILGNSEGERQNISRMGSWNEVHQMDADLFFHQKELAESIATQYKESGVKVSLLSQDQTQLSLADQINQYELNFEQSFDSLGFGGDFGTHTGLPAILRPDASWISLSSELKNVGAVINIESLRQKAFISGCEGSGQSGRMIGDLSIYNLKESKGFSEFKQNYWDLRLWDDEGDFLKALSLKDSIDLIITAVTSGLTMGGSIGVWASMGINCADEFLFAAGNTMTAASSAEVTQEWLNFLSTAGASAVSCGIGGLSELEKVTSLGKTAQFFAESGISIGGGILSSLVANSTSGLQVSSAGLEWDSSAAINSYFGKNQIGSTASLFASSIVSNGLGIIDTSGYLTLDSSRIDSFNSLAGELIGTTISSAITQSADFNILNLTDFSKGKVDCGLLSLHLEKNNSNLTISNQGTSVNLYRLVTAGMGAALYDETRRISHSSSDNIVLNGESIRALASALRASDSTEEVMKKLKSLINGDISLESVIFEDSENSFIAKTNDVEGELTIQIDQDLLLSDKEAAKEYLAVILAHELQRNGLDLDNKTETLRSLLAHSEVASILANSNPQLMESHPELAAEIKIVSQLMSDGDYEALARYASIIYKSDKDYWKLSEYGDLIDDGTSHLYWELTGKRVVSNTTGSSSQALAQYLGVERVSELLELSSMDLKLASSYDKELIKDHFDLTDEQLAAVYENKDFDGIMNPAFKKFGNRWIIDISDKNDLQKLLGKALFYDLGYRWNNQAARWTEGGGELQQAATFKIKDDLYNSVLFDTELNSDLEYNKYQFRMTAYRNYDSYNSKFGWIKPNAMSNHRGQDYMIYEKLDLDGNVLDAHLIENVQTVDVYNKYDNISQVNRDQDTDSTIQGNTLMSEQFRFRWNGSQRYNVYGTDVKSPTFMISDCTTLDGDEVDHFSSDGEPGGRWLVHPCTRLYSDGCFIPSVEEAGKFFEKVYTWGLTDAYQGFNVEGKLKHTGDVDSLFIIESCFDRQNRSQIELSKTNNAKIKISPVGNPFSNNNRFSTIQLQKNTQAYSPHPSIEKE